MKKTLLILSLLLVSGNSFANWQDSDWSEPTIGCVAGGGAFYFLGGGATTMKNLQNFAIGCGIGGFAAYQVNKYYKHKVGRSYGSKIKTLEEHLEVMQIQRARGSANGIVDHPLLHNEVIEGHMSPTGEWIHPTVKTRLKAPGHNLTIGD